MSTVGITEAKKVAAALGAVFAVAKAAIEKKPIFPAILAKLNYAMELSSLNVFVLPTEVVDIQESEAHEIVTAFYEAAK